MDIKKCLGNDSLSVNSIQNACGGGDVVKLQKYVDCFGNINAVLDASGRTLLHYGCQSEKSLTFLIKNGADVNVCDADGLTPLHYVINVSLDKAKILLDAGANPDMGDIYGDTPLHTINDNRFFMKRAKLLLAYGADPNIKNDMGFTFFDDCEESIVNKLMRYIDDLGLYVIKEPN